MRIALICNTYIRNYGSVLQSLASYVMLQEIADDVKVVNYIDEPTPKAKRKIFLYVKLPLILNPNTLGAKIKKIILSKLNAHFSKIQMQRGLAMRQFVYENFVFTDECKTTGEAKNEIMKQDVVVVGSDQLWGPVDILRDYHTLSFLPDDFRKVSYATSFGVSKLPTYVRKRASHFLKRFQSISVREDSGADIVEQMIGKRPVVVADPTLLLEARQWSDVLGDNRRVKGNYIFAFFLGGNKTQREFVKKASATVGFPIVSMQHVDEYIEADENFADVNINDASPADFVNLIQYADMIFTDSFHASIFSILYHKKFYTFDRYNASSSNSRNSRIVSLFSHLGITEQHLLGTENINEILKKNVNYEQVEEQLSAWREYSLDYLKEALR